MRDISTELDLARPASNSGRAAFQTYLPRLSELISDYPAADILELGGGRDPSFKLSELPSNVATYTVNDIDAAELALAGPEYRRAKFDVIGNVQEFESKYDVIFSRTLAEHVKDGRAMHANVLKLLRPGGVAFHMMPTLYAPPFVLNLMLPEGLSRRVLHAFFPHRRDDRPKFPAYYSWCFGNRSKMERMLSELGYEQVSMTNFYGHNYFKAVPVLGTLDRTFSSLAAKRDWTSFSSFGHICARKPGPRLRSRKPNARFSRERIAIVCGPE
jgi:SAM-dependent methyltransferase